MVGPTSSSGVAGLDWDWFENARQGLFLIVLIRLGLRSSFFEGLRTGLGVRLTALHKRLTVSVAIARVLDVIVLSPLVGRPFGT